MQEVVALTLVALAVAWLGWRWLVRRRAATCCGERQCPATQRVLDRLP